MTGLGGFAKAEALAERGETYYSRGQYAEAWAEFNHAVELQPNLGWAIYGRGEASRMLGRYIEALTDFYPRHRTYSRTRGWLCLARRDLSYA